MPNFVPLWVYKLNRVFPRSSVTKQVRIMLTRQTTIGLMTLVFISITPAIAQSAVNSGAATGDFGNSTERSWQDSGASQVNQQYQAFDRFRPLGSGFGNSKDTLRTRTQNYLMNSGGLPETATGLNATKSVSPSPMNSGGFSLGFSGSGGSRPYTGPYRSGPYGDSLPATSTSSIDFDVTSGDGGFNLRAPGAASKFLDFARNGGYWEPDFNMNNLGNTVQQIQQGTQKIQNGNVGGGATQINNAIQQHASNGF